MELSNYEISDLERTNRKLQNQCRATPQEYRTPPILQEHRPTSPSISRHPIRNCRDSQSDYASG